MGSNDFDVVVVGAGLAGVTAAVAAAGQGDRIALATAGPGSFALGPGWLQAEEIRELADVQELREAIAFFCEMTRSAGYPFEGGVGTTRSLPTILGDFQNVAMAPALLWSAEPRHGGVVSVAGIRGLSSFDENFMADRLNEHSRRTGSTCTYSARQIALPGVSRGPIDILRIAECFDRDSDFRMEIAEALRLAASGCDSILVPAIFGISSCVQRLSELASRAGCPVGEIPTLPPSILGLRLFHSLMSYLSKIGAEVFQGFPVESIKGSSNGWLELRVASPGHAMMLRGKSVVWAAGQRSVSLLHEERLNSKGPTGIWEFPALVIGPDLCISPPAPHCNPVPKGGAMDILAGYCAGKLAADRRSCHAAR